MQTYQFVEDYLEALAGYDPLTLHKVIFPNKKYNISLARYDISIVENMSTETMFGHALTDRQGELAVKLVLKYRRQFANIGIDVTPVEAKIFRLPLRKIDRQRRIWIDSEDIHMKFPYDQSMIDEVKEFKKESQGRANWDNQKKIWTFGITEYMINWLVPWGRLHNFDIDTNIIDMFDKIVACERRPYAIRLVFDGEHLSIENASSSLLDYIHKTVGELTVENLTKLIDLSGVLGYVIGDDILAVASEEYGTMLEYIGTRHTSWLDPRDSSDYWNKILDYCELTNRYPICLYDPNVLDNLDTSRFAETEIVRFDQNGKTATSNYNPYGVKLVYARKIPDTWEFPVPLLVSTVEMMFGGTKLGWLNKADKIIYLTQGNIRDN